MELGHLVRKSDMRENVVIHVEAARNAWVEITELTREKNIDFIVMMTYGGTIIRGEFIGSTAWKVIQEASVPVISLTP